MLSERYHQSKNKVKMGGREGKKKNQSNGLVWLIIFYKIASLFSGLSYFQLLLEPIQCTQKEFTDLCVAKIKRHYM